MTPQEEPSVAGPARAFPKLIVRPLRDGERDVMAHALRNAGLPADDLDAPGRLFFRFETPNGLLAGFGGLELFDGVGLLRSIVALPPLRGRGFGHAIVSALETEAAAHRCDVLYLLTTGAQDFFGKLGYRVSARDDVPAAIRQTAQFAMLCPATAAVLMKRIG
jgi:N-acetylglutamate synthase-like GNAT family acetyltransferase